MSAALGEGPGEEDPLLLAAGEPADLPVGQVGDPEFVQRARPPGRGRPAQPPEEPERGIAALLDDARAP